MAVKTTDKPVKQGRPFSGKPTRVNNVTVRLDNEELEMLDTYLSENGNQKRSTFMRALLLKTINKK